jgi:hypothetical protein
LNRATDPICRSKADGTESQPFEIRVSGGEVIERLELIYQDAATNLRFLKQQEWVITRYALTAYAVLVGLATQMTFRCPLVVAVVLMAVLDAVILHQFIGSMQRFRDRRAEAIAVGGE